MGMFSEIHADENCKSYEAILKEAIESKNADVMRFCKEHVYERYKWELAEAFRKEDETIKQHFSTR